MKSQDATSVTVSKPDLVYRVALAGNRRLNAASLTMIRGTLSAVFSSAMSALQSQRAQPKQVPERQHFYSDKPPCLRLITGLAEGADSLAAEVLLSQPQDNLQRWELAAILPFPLADFVNSRDPSLAMGLPDCRQLHQACHYVLELDGIYAKPTPDTELAKARRTRAYRAQATVLLRHADLLVVIIDPAAEASSGGTLETIAQALKTQLPVLALDASSGRLAIVEPGEDADQALADARWYAADAADAADAAGWQPLLAAWIRETVAEPVLAGSPSSAHGEVVSLFLGMQPSSLTRGAAGKRRQTLRERSWKAFERRFLPPEHTHSNDASPGDLRRDASDLKLQPYQPIRQRAADLSAHYTGLYRGTFLLNYIFAVSAVIIATLSLLIMGQQHTAAVSTIAVPLHHVQDSTATATATPATTTDSAAAPPAAASPAAASPAASESAAAPPQSHWPASATNALLLLLASFKFLLVFFIYRNTHQANHRHWNDLAIDYRYLAERLRAAYYLPLAGSFRWPGASSAQFATRLVRQSSIDWLLHAYSRSISPAAVERLHLAASPDAASADVASTPVALSVQPLRAVESIRDHWLASQIAYHQKNAAMMNRISSQTDLLGRVLNWIVMIVVAVDVIVLLLYLLHWWPETVERLHHLAPYLVFLSAILPAVVAGLNGIRFQSECQRLSDRSAVMQKLLTEHQLRAAALAERIAHHRNSPATDPGSWTPDVLRIGEQVARDLAEEVTEWSIVYTKVVVEP